MSYRKFCAEVFDPPPFVESPPPPEWEPPTGYGQHYETLGTTVDGEPTIFISIASYRDDLCHNTIKEALRMAEHPRRLFFGAVEQSIPSQGDLPCNFTMVPCDVDPSQLLCVYSGQITVHRVDARGAQGPTYGRYRADRLYRGEYFALQIDAHMYFVANWDTEMIKQWKATGNEYAVLTTYPSAYAPGSMDGSGHSSHKSTPLICKSEFDVDGMVRHQAAGEIFPMASLNGSPILQPVWAAGSSFSRGHRVARVPYGLLRLVFNGEETVMALRMWTSGYDFYTFHHVLLFHTYNRKTRPKTFWENTQQNGLKAKTMENVEIMLGLRRPLAGYDTKDISPGAKYGLGQKRQVSTFLRLWGYDLRHKAARDNCPWAYSQEMHMDLTAHLRPDGMGIDYGKVPVDEIVQRHGWADLPSQDLAW
ncbi:unnamed protein product [Prorocentrum cordatum]|uniref:Uncharacterized protein n=1 Tax=Prorocentrum cordatum TaxID=2364126 RepID=A0ABN9SQN7_9DINO|nr:unnamed protein product [Polarella glacialis]